MLNDKIVFNSLYYRYQNILSRNPTQLNPFLVNLPWCASINSYAFTIANCMLLFSTLHSAMYCGSLKSAPTGMFAPRKWAHTLINFCFIQTVITSKPLPNFISFYSLAETTTITIAWPNDFRACRLMRIKQQIIMCNVYF